MMKASVPIYDVIFLISRPERNLAMFDLPVTDIFTGPAEHGEVPTGEGRKRALDRLCSARWNLASD